MSRLSDFFRKNVNRNIIRSVVDYVGQFEVSGETKKAIALKIIKTLHVDTGGQWDEVIERAVDGSIEYIVGEVKHYTQHAADLGVPVTTAPAQEPLPPPIAVMI